jgi:hypothetical protein
LQYDLIGGIRTHNIQLYRLASFPDDFNELIVPTGFEPVSPASKARMIDLYTMGLYFISRSRAVESKNPLPVWFGGFVHNAFRECRRILGLLIESRRGVFIDNWGLGRCGIPARGDFMVLQW